MTKIDWQKFSPRPIIGVDEVGRGCLAGPVYAGAVIIDESASFELYTDSKLLSEKRREKLYEHIKLHHRHAVGFATVEEISRLNILQASLLAMKRAIVALGVKDGHVLVDGNQRIPNLPASFLQTPIVKGDLRASPIAAASILAKVTRDRIMKDLDKDFPQYGFASHKGYSTKDHKEAIAQHGPIEWHRPTFAGVKEYLRPNQ